MEKVELAIAFVLSLFNMAVCGIGCIRDNRRAAWLTLLIANIGMLCWNFFVLIVVMEVAEREVLRGLRWPFVAVREVGMILSSVGLFLMVFRKKD